jgi:segregation and condensation protein A
VSQSASQHKATLPRDMVQQVLPLALIRGEVVVNKPQDLFIPPDALEVILESFEGPLDLLLYLIRKQKFDILDMPIAPITTQYMQYIELMKEIKMELAAEYLVMAAILMEIKSRLLLPKQAVVEEDEDPRAELVRRLQEYEVIKNAAQQLDGIPRLERDTFQASVELSEDFQAAVFQTDVELNELVSALQGILKRTKALEHHHIEKESLSTRERMSAILAHLKRAATTANAFVEFSALFSVQEGRQGVVVTFLAILELIKESLIECIQTTIFGQLRVRLPA